MLVLLLLLLIVVPFVSPSDDEDPLYLYNGVLDSDKFWPVQDLFATNKTTTTTKTTEVVIQQNDTSTTERTKTKKEIVIMPKLLTEHEMRNRVVEFYAPWCPHCQEFRWHYIEFARNCSAFAKNSYGIDIDFHAISCTANQKICRKQSIGAYPTIRIYPSGSSNYTEVVFWNVHCFTVLKALINTNNMELLEEEETNSNHEQHETTTTRSNSQLRRNNKKSSTTTAKDDTDTDTIIHDSRTSTIILDDAFLSFDFAMRQSIYMKEGPLSNSTAVVFRDWIALLRLVLPPLWKIHNALDSIVLDMDRVVKDEQYLLDIMDTKGPSSKLHWHGCTSESSHGYTCGLWELFHIVSVSVVEWNNAAVTPHSIVTTEYVATMLYSYVSEFFGCDVCRRNFISNFDSCSQNRCHRLGNSDTSHTEWKQLPLWLWEEHNDVNVRLKLEQKQKKNKHAQLTSQEIENAKWPSRYDCPSCWQEDGTFDDDIIYKYLRLQYWPASHIRDATSIQYARDIQLANNNVLIQKSEKDSMDNNDFNDDVRKQEEMNMYIVLGIPSLGILTLVITSILKQMELDRTGRHKKNEN